MQPPPLPLPADMLDRAYASIARWEGSILHLYLDSRGNVTIGVGCMLPNVAAALNLDLKPRDAIARDFGAVHAAEWPHVATWYAPLTTSRIQPADARALYRLRADSFCKALIRVFPRYASFPESVQVALLDMVFNLGVAGWLKKFPLLRLAVVSHDWRTCSAECLRSDAQPGRNAATAALFASAAGDARALV